MSTPMQLQEIARVLRSKNAGPCLVTFDLIFDRSEDFERVRSQVARLRSEVAARYGRSENEVRVIDYAPAQAVKITIPRDIMSGDPGDRDVYGAQQHAPLLEIEV
ncbi:hypothetical protein AA309_24640 [Microvirga vignae]|uniref:DUF4387 domain-containing protein n=2 Tax=Microvirga vignae TaxID=1225564 RepID=A0A0H1R5W5_9HYPH|nr:hypothetical protein AA309_24640 [Microvirga vignae]